MNNNLLKQLNISEKDFLIYEKLYEFGASSALELSETLEIPRSTVHHILKKLQKIGLVGRSIDDSSGRYFAGDLHIIQSILNQRRDEILNLEKEVQSAEQSLLMFRQDHKAKRTTGSISSAVDKYEGKKGVLEAYEKMLKSTQVIKAYGNASWVTKELPSVRNTYKKSILSGDLSIKSILIDSNTSKELVNYFENIDNYDVRFVKQGINLEEVDYSIFDNGVAIFSYKKIPTATIHYDMLFRNHAEAVFDYVWNTL